MFNKINYIVKLGFIFIFHLSAYTMQAPAFSPKIILLGADYDHPSAYAFQLELLEQLIKDEKAVIVNEESISAQSLEERIEIARINAQAMNEILAIKKAIAKIFSSPELSIKGSEINIRGDDWERIIEVINDLNSKEIFKSNLGKMIADNPRSYAINIIKWLHPNALATEINEDIIKLFTSKFKLDFFNFIIKNKIELRILENKDTVDDAFRQKFPIISDDLNDYNNQKVINVYNKYEDAITNVMAYTIFNQYQNCLNNNTVILSHIRLLHTKRIAAKLLKYGVPIENIEVIHLNNRIHNLSYKFPKMFNTLESRLDADQVIRDYLDQIYPVKILTPYHHNNNTEAFELNKPKAWNMLINNILTQQKTKLCDGFHCMKDEPSVKLMSCTRCHKAKYCSKDCQARHWRSHQYDCHKAKK